MKKIVLTAAALFVLAGSTFTASAVAPSAAPKAVAKKSVVKTNFLPPTCPPSDPNGCGILD